MHLDIRDSIYALYILREDIHPLLLPASGRNSTLEKSCLLVNRLLGCLDHRIYFTYHFCKCHNSTLPVLKTSV